MKIAASSLTDTLKLATPLLGATCAYAAGQSITSPFMGIVVVAGAVVMRSLSIAHPNLRRWRDRLVPCYIVSGAGMALFRHLSAHGQEDKSVAALINKIESCPQSHRVWSELQRKEGPIGVAIGKHEQAPTGAIRDLAARRIVLSERMNPTGQLALLLEQICEWLDGADLIDVSTRASRGELSKMDMLRMAVEPGLATSETHHKIASACVEQHGWDPHTDIFKGTYLTNPNARWFQFLKDPQQAVTREAYFRDWERLFKDVFCAKNRMHPDCK